MIFDLGGVVLDSPMGAIARFERSAEIAAGSVNRTVKELGGAGAWAAFERGELDRDEFQARFADELGLAGPWQVPALLDELDRGMGARPEVIRLIRAVRSSGLLAAALTNNWASFPSHGLRDEFDVFVESVVEGTRKPEPEIYQICLARLGVEPETCVMLDDIGANLKPARDMGMTTILVRNEQQLIADLTTLLAG